MTQARRQHSILTRPQVRGTWRTTAAWAAAALLLGLACGASAQTTAPLSPLFKDADLKLGEKLIVEHQCSTCHARRVGGDGRAIYRPLGKINTAGLLRGMVDYCSTELNLGLFPEEVSAVAAVLDRDHYRFAARR